jgi:MFS family permease
MALSNVALFGGSFLTPVLVGKITYTLGWQWTFYLVAIFTAAALPFMIFFVPETAFRRADYLNTDFIGDSYEQAGSSEAADHSDSQAPIHSSEAPADMASHPGKEPQSVPDEEKTLRTRPNGEAAESGPPPAKVSYWKTLRLFNGRKTDEAFFKLLLRPFPLFFHPGILWVS